MAKINKAQLIREGKIILRAKTVRARWCVFNYTSGGRWKKFKGNYDCFNYKESCESFIDALIRNDSNIVKDE